MTERTLCDEGVAVKVTGSGTRAFVEIVDGITLRFECHSRMLRGVLEGSPLQLSAREGFCLLERRTAIVRLEYGISGEGRRTCEFPAGDLGAALDEIEKQ